MINACGENLAQKNETDTSSNKAGATRLPPVPVVLRPTFPVNPKLSDSTSSSITFAAMTNAASDPKMIAHALPLPPTCLNLVGAPYTQLLQSRATVAIGAPLLNLPPANTKTTTANTHTKAFPTFPAHRSAAALVQHPYQYSIPSYSQDVPTPYSSVLRGMYHPRPDLYHPTPPRSYAPPPHAYTPPPSQSYASGLYPGHAPLGPYRSPIPAQQVAPVQQQARPYDYLIAHPPSTDPSISISRAYHAPPAAQLLVKNEAEKLLTVSKGATPSTSTSTKDKKIDAEKEEKRESPSAKRKGNIIPEPPHQTRQKTVATRTTLLEQGIVLTGRSIAGFTMEQLAQLPTATAFSLKDPEKAARRKKRAAANKQKSSTKKATLAKTTARRQAPVEVECCAPDEEVEGGWPPGWLRRKFERKSGATAGSFDRYWYSPKTGKKFRSMTEIKRFLLLVKQGNGDEDAAWLLFKRGK